MCTIWEMAETIRAEERKAQEAQSPPQETAGVCSSLQNAHSQSAETGAFRARLQALAAMFANRRHGTGIKS